MPLSDITIKQYNSGKLEGHTALFFNTDRAKELYKQTMTDSLYCLAYKTTGEVMAKAESYCTNNRMHYEVVIIN